MAKLHITVREELKEKLKLVAEKKKRSLNFIVNEALIQYTKKFKNPKDEDPIYRVGCEDKDTGSYEYECFKDIKSAEDYAKNPQWFWATIVIEENGITRLLKEYKLGVLVEKEYLING